MGSKGLLGQKIGMTQIWNENNEIVPVTVIKAGPCTVTQIKTVESDKYAAIQIGFGEVKDSRLTSPQRGHLAKAGVSARRYLTELRVTDTTDYAVGQVIDVSLFEAGQLVDVSGVSKGKGFAGGMKRHNFKGQGASHGNHKKHRAPGSIGACATPGRVFKGTRMAGRMGGRKVTTQNLEVVQSDTEQGLLLIKGAVPGPNGGLVLIREAVRATKGGEA
ncbi:MAG: 50S ribosomal protein L3 [Actinobacteria bacterium]|nr:50S ribosomal protein L3 [Actinomycetota bacterium]MCB9389867.1 50S ribosomal protein L3 [Acidimicrobiia bacterium]